MRLFLQAAQSAGNCGFEEIAYEFFSQSFIIYEESVSENKEQLAAIELLISTLQVRHTRSQSS